MDGQVAALAAEGCTEQEGPSQGRRRGEVSWSNSERAGSRAVSRPRRSRAGSGGRARTLRALARVAVRRQVENMVRGGGRLVEPEWELRSTRAEGATPAVITFALPLRGPNLAITSSHAATWLARSPALPLSSLLLLSQPATLHLSPLRLLRGTGGIPWHVRTVLCSLSRVAPRRWTCPTVFQIDPFEPAAMSLLARLLLHQARRISAADMHPRRRLSERSRREEDARSRGAAVEEDEAERRRRRRPGGVQLQYVPPQHDRATLGCSRARSLRLRERKSARLVAPRALGPLAL